MQTDGANGSSDPIRFHVPGFVAQGDSEGMLVWHGPQGDGIGLASYEKPSTFEGDLSDPQTVRDHCRRSALASQMGLVEADPVVLDGCRAIRSVLKQPQPTQGTRYMGLLILPLADFDAVIRVQCEEHGVTGLREAMVLDALLAAGQIDLGQMQEGGKIPGWEQDPYDPRIQTPIMPNQAESVRYDAQFPDHPLSRLRAILQQIQATLQIAPELKTPRL